MSKARISCLTASFRLLFLKLKFSLGSDEPPLLDFSSLDVVMIEAEVEVEVDLEREVEDDEELPPALRRRFIAEGQCKRDGV